MKRAVQILASLVLLLGWHPVASWGQAPVLDAANAFVTRWQGEAGEPIQVPLYGNYAYRWEKADGTEVASGVANVAEKELLELPVAEAGEYVLRAGPGGVKRIEFGVLHNEEKYYVNYRGTPGALLRVAQWGSVAWESFAGAFYGCANMNVADGAGKPDLSGVASMQSAFESCGSFNSPIGDWDVSKVTSMREMFDECTSFDQPLGAWDVSKVTSMREMFDECTSFNQPLGAWDVSRVEDMRYMFWECRAFNHPLANWDVSRVEDMGGMFEGCRAFNHPLANWNVSRVEDMGGMFEGCSAFNQPLEKWDVSKVTRMARMFEECRSFNQPLETWDVSKVTSMRGMFEGCSSFNQPLAKWDVSKVTSMREMFDECTSFNQPLGNWTPSSLRRAGSKEQDLGLQFSGLSVENYSEMLVAWAAKRDQLQAKVKVDAEGLKYDAAGKAARQQLIDDKAWEFAGDGEATVASPAVEIVGAPTWLAVGATHAFTARVVPAEAPQAVTWSVKGYGAAFTDNQLEVTEEGTITVTATSEAVATSKRSVQISVIVPVALAGITVSPTTALIEIGGAQQLTVGYTPADATNRAVTWSSSDAGVATVDAAGVVTAKGKGSATITATAADGGHTATCAVTVVAPVPLTGITVNPTSKTLKVNETLQLTVAYTPADATNRAVTWSSSDEEVATVDATGVVTAKGKGEATITVTSADGGHTSTCAVTVTPVALTGITVSPTSARLKAGETQQLTVGYTPEDATNKSVMWSSDNESVATVDATGLVTAKGKGTATITAKSADGGHTATCAVTVEAAPVALTGITVSPTSAQIGVGGTHRLVVSYIPADAANKTVTWSSDNESVATVDAEGKVTAKGEGTATITATSADGGHTATCNVKVTAPVSLTGITVSPASVQIGVGGTHRLVVGYIPANAANRNVTWRSDNASVATVDARGVVKGEGEGSATITATSADGGHTATCAVEVTAPVVLTGITVSPTSAQLKVGETQQLTVGYTPADATNKSVTWSSSDAGVATVDAQGKVTGVKGGSATITVTAEDGGHTATCLVTVVADEKPSGVESVALAGVSVSPNPFGDALLVRGAERVVRYSLVSATGVVVLGGAHAGGGEFMLATSHLPMGIYWLRLVAVDGERVVQVVRR